MERYRDFFLLKSSLFGWSWWTQERDRVELINIFFFSLSCSTQPKYQSVRSSGKWWRKCTHEIYILSRPFFSSSSSSSVWTFRFTDSEIAQHWRRESEICSVWRLEQEQLTHSVVELTEENLWFGHATRTKRNSMRVRKSLFSSFSCFFFGSRESFPHRQLRTHLVFNKTPEQHTKLYTIICMWDIYILNKQWPHSVEPFNHIQQPTARDFCMQCRLSCPADKISSFSK